MKLIRGISIILVLLVLGFAQGYSQDYRLALQYYESGEFEKAAELFEKLHQKEPGSEFFFNKYLESLLALENFTKSERIIREEIDEEPGNISLYVLYGRVLEEQGKLDEADKIYKNAIKNLPADRIEIVRLGVEFVRKGKFEYAIDTYRKGEKLLDNDYIFAYNLGDLYRQKGDKQQMVHFFLKALEQEQSRITNIKLLLQRYLQEESDWNELQKQLYSRIQDHQENPLYPELLAWVFIQKHDYTNALRQVRALDMRLQEAGSRVMDLAQMAINDRKYDVAIDAYQYMVDNKQKTNPYFLKAHKQLLNTKRQKLVEGFSYSPEELEVLRDEYLAFLNDHGRNKTTTPILYDLAQLEALYINDLDAAIAHLQELIEYPDVDRLLLANAKLSLADYYLIAGDRWESTLLYSQVDKAFQEDVIGQRARFKNAKLSYFVGDFLWAQAQFDVLKASTSKLIANDALDMSVFIMDNMGLDTTTAPLEMYARAELLTFQNRLSEAEEALDSLVRLYPGHNLRDDIFFAKALLYEKQRQFEKAAEMYHRVIEDDPEGIRADNSLFNLAELYEHQLNDTPKAMELYERLFTDYSGSTFAVEARKRFRLLRGDFDEAPIVPEDPTE